MTTPTELRELARAVSDAHAAHMVARSVDDGYTERIRQAERAEDDAIGRYRMATSDPAIVEALCLRLERQAHLVADLSGNPGCYGKNPMTTPLLPARPQESPARE